MGLHTREDTYEVLRFAVFVNLVAVEISMNDLGFVYIAEKTSPDDYAPKNLSVHREDGIFYVEFESAVHSFGVMNRNSRMYESSNVEKCLHTERIQHYLSHGGWYGEQDHPMQKYKDKALSPDRIRSIDMNNTSHRLLNPHLEGNLLVSKIQSDAGTKQGENLAKKMVQGFKPGFSCRAIATLVMKNGKPVVDVRQVIAYDWVLYQSHREAEQLMRTPNKFVSKLAAIGESVKDKVNEFGDTLIPLKEILEDVAHTDVTTQFIMESFDLHDDDLMGFSKSKDHILLRDETNMIYCNINMDSKKKLNDYLRSF